MRVFYSFSILFCLFVVSKNAFASRRSINRTLVIVNNEPILESDVSSFMKKIKSKSFQELFNDTDFKALKDRDSIIRMLIEEKLIEQQIKKLDLSVSEQEIDGQIRAILKRNGISILQLEERLRQLETSIKDYRDGIRRQLERKNLVDREIRPQFEVSDEQLRHYYLRSSNSGEGEKQFKIAHILMEEKKGSLPASSKAKKVWEELKNNPEKFDDFTKEYSDDPTPSGLIGFFNMSSLSKEFREVVPKTPVGQITPPIKTSAGYHIVKVLEISKNDFSIVSKEHRELLKAQMVSEELEKRMTSWLERKKAEIHIEWLEVKP